MSVSLSVTAEDIKSDIKRIRRNIRHGIYSDTDNVVLLRWRSGLAFCREITFMSFSDEHNILLGAVYSSDIKESSILQCKPHFVSYSANKVTVPSE